LALFQLKSSKLLSVKRHSTPHRVERTQRMSLKLVIRTTSQRRNRKSAPFCHRLSTRSEKGVNTSGKSETISVIASNSRRCSGCGLRFQQPKCVASRRPRKILSLFVLDRTWLVKGSAPAVAFFEKTGIGLL
jgi:hypothetical protein